MGQSVVNNKMASSIFFGVLLSWEKAVKVVIRNIRIKILFFLLVLCLTAGLNDGEGRRPMLAFIQC